MVDQGINKNGTAKYAAEHYYQLTDSYSNKTKYTAELLQSKWLTWLTGSKILCSVREC